MFIPADITQAILRCHSSKNQSLAWQLPYLYLIPQFLKYIPGGNILDEKNPS